MRVTVTVFDRSPDGGRGLARDTRVRWALEEVGQAYAVRGIGFDAMKAPEYRARQPFGQIPLYEEEGEEALVLFESGAIVLRIAERFRGLLPDAPRARARAIGWMFAAVNTVEPPILELANARLLERDAPWTAERLPALRERVVARLDQLAAWLGPRDWLEGDFTAGDLMMVSVLQRLKPSGVLTDIAPVAAYVARAEARPAYARAFAAQAAFNTRPA